MQSTTLAFILISYLIGYTTAQYTCPYDCSSCDYYGITCYTCDSGYGLYAGDCYVCPDGCSTCSTSSDGVLVYTKCYTSTWWIWVIVAVACVLLGAILRACIIRQRVNRRKQQQQQAQTPVITVAQGSSQAPIMQQPPASWNQPQPAQQPGWNQRYQAPQNNYATNY